MSAMQDQSAIWEARYVGGRESDAPTQPTAFCRGLAGHLHPACQVLEIGCAIGSDAAYLTSLGHDVLATDVSPTAIASAMQRHDGIECLRCLPHDASQPFDLPDASLDAVYARLSLHYFTDVVTRAIFAEIARLLRPGGLVAFMCKSLDDPLYGKGTSVEPHVFEYNHLRHFFSDSYARELLAPSFEVVSIESKDGLLYGSPSAWVEAIARRKQNPKT